MNKQIDFSYTGGFPLDEDTLGYLQSSYTGALAAVAKLAGDKVILTGVVVTGSTVSAGWISYAGRLIPFLGGSVAAKVYIQNAGSVAMFEDGVNKTVFFEETATCAALGDFNFSELVRLSSLQNIWLPGDLKQKYVDNAYIAANFDVSGYGLNAEIGWRILSSAVPAAAGKVLINRDAADTDFDTAGKNGGEKTHTLLGTETGTLKIKAKINDADGGAETEYQGISMNGQLIPKDGGANATSYGSEITVRLNNDAIAHNNLQPYFVVLTLIKL
jgi:hypothetical protein